MVLVSQRVRLSSLESSLPPKPPQGVRSHPRPHSHPHHPSGGRSVSIDTAIVENALARSAQATDEMPMLVTGNRCATPMLTV